jgi:hypothetical protein
MADESTNTETQGTQSTGTADQSAASTTTASPSLTAADVQKMIDEATQKAFNSGAAAARREAEAKAKKPPTTEPPKTTNNETNQTQAQPAIDGFALSEAMAEFTLTKDQRKTIRDLAGKEGPGDLDEFVTKWAGLFGAKKAGEAATSTNNNTTQSQQQTQQTNTQKPPNVPGAAATDDRELGSIFKALPEDAARDTWQAYVRRKGANPANPYDPRNRQAWREMRKQFEAGVATASIQLGARRG